MAAGVTNNNNNNNNNDDDDDDDDNHKRVLGQQASGTCNASQFSRQACSEQHECRGDQWCIDPTLVVSVKPNTALRVTDV